MKTWIKLSLGVSALLISVGAIITEQKHSLFSKHLSKPTSEAMATPSKNEKMPWDNGFTDAEKYILNDIVKDCMEVSTT